MTWKSENITYDQWCNRIKSVIGILSSYLTNEWWLRDRESNLRNDFVNECWWWDGPCHKHGNTNGMISWRSFTWSESQWNKLGHTGPVGIWTFCRPCCNMSYVVKRLKNIIICKLEAHLSQRPPQLVHPCGIILTLKMCTIICSIESHCIV